MNVNESSLDFLLDEKAIETLLTPESLEDYISSSSEENEASSPSRVDFSDLSPLLDFSKEIPSMINSNFWDLGSLNGFVPAEQQVSSPSLSSSSYSSVESSPTLSTPLQSSPSLFIKQEPQDLTEVIRPADNNSSDSRKKNATPSQRKATKQQAQAQDNNNKTSKQTQKRQSTPKDCTPSPQVAVKQEKTAHCLTGHKRRRPQFEPVDTEIFLKDGRFTELSSEELIKLDGDQIELYIQTLRSFRNLSSGEEKETKRIRRLIKNREYAQSSRNKKKEYVDVIEQEVDELKKETQDLNEKVSCLEEENNSLRAQLAQIGNLLKGMDNDILKKVSEITAAFSSTPKEDSSSKTKRPAKKAKTVALFIFLFTFVFSCFSASSPFFSGPVVFNSPTSSSVSPSGTNNAFSTRLLLSNESLLEKEVPTFFQQYAPMFVQTLVAKFNTERTTASPLLLTHKGNEAACLDPSEMIFQKRTPSISLESAKPLTENQTHSCGETSNHSLKTLSATI